MLYQLVGSRHAVARRLDRRRVAILRDHALDVGSLPCKADVAVLGRKFDTQEVVERSFILDVPFTQRTIIVTIMVRRDVGSKEA